MLDAHFYYCTYLDCRGIKAPWSFEDGALVVWHTLCHWLKSIYQKNIGDEEKEEEKDEKNGTHRCTFKKTFPSALFTCQEII